MSHEEHMAAALASLIDEIERLQKDHRIPGWAVASALEEARAALDLYWQSFAPSTTRSELEAAKKNGGEHG